MNGKTFLFAVTAILIACGVNAKRSEAAPQSQVVSYACNDVVVVGRARDQKFTHLPANPDDIIGHGRIDMKIDVKRTLFGNIRKTTIEASVIAHTFQRQDHDFLFVLRAKPDGGYAIQDGYILGFGRKPSLAKKCS